MEVCKYGDGDASRGARIKTVIHVNQHVIKSNYKTGAKAPPLTVKRGRVNHRAKEVTLYGPSKVVYRPNKPLSCGARCWIETESAVGVDSRGRDEPPQLQLSIYFDKKGYHYEFLQSGKMHSVDRQTFRVPPAQLWRLRKDVLIGLRRAVQPLMTQAYRKPRVSSKNRK